MSSTRGTVDGRVYSAKEATRSSTAGAMDSGDTRRAPVIGITASVERARWRDWNRQVVLLPVEYVAAVAEAGGRPLVVPPLEEHVEETLDALDGLMVGGGRDIDPATYGAIPHRKTGESQTERDRGELALVHAADERKLPVLGICRGMQLLNVARGGTLDQHLPDRAGHEAHRLADGAHIAHPVTVRRASQLASLVGERPSVPSYHHQAPARLGAGLEAVAWADDGIVEGLEDPRRRFWIGVLWHPEVGADPSLFQALVAAASLEM